jgi:hypothetical protein
MNRIARNLTDAEDGLLQGKRDLIHDRDLLFTEEFLATLTEAGVESVRLPHRVAEPEQLRGTLRQKHKGVVSGTDDSVWRGISAYNSSGVCRAFITRNETIRASAISSLFLITISSPEMVRFAVGIVSVEC